MGVKFDFSLSLYLESDLVLLFQLFPSDCKLIHALEFSASEENERLYSLFRIDSGVSDYGMFFSVLSLKRKKQEVNST
jgi:hypothetical protein